MATIISFINLKGGVGKTTCSVAVSEFLAEEYKRRVLVVDLDPQTNATISLITEQHWKAVDQQNQTISQLFQDKLEKTNVFDIRKAILPKVSNLHGGIDRLALLPSSVRLIYLQDQLGDIGARTGYAVNPVDVLGGALQPVLQNFDYVIIDCPPNLGLITLNGLKISSGYIIPVIPDILSTFGLEQIQNRVGEFSRNWGKPVPPKGIIISKYRAASALHKDTLVELQRRETAGTLPHIFQSRIAEANKIAESVDVEAQVNTLKQKYGSGDTYDRFKDLTEEFIKLCP